MIIKKFTELGSKIEWISKIRNCDWRAAGFLADLLEQERFNQVLGNGCLFVLADGENLVSFATLTQKDCIDDDRLFPWIGFVFTVPEYRGKRYSGRIIAHACKAAQEQGFEAVYIATDHTGLYEKYGFEYVESRTDIYGEESRIYRRALRKNGNTEMLKSFLDGNGRLTAFPAKRKMKLYALMYLSEKFEKDRSYTEKEVNALLCEWHTFGDPATLRRELYNHRFIDRDSLGKEYRLEDVMPTIEELEKRYE